ncbi:hypothetical protein L1987_37068 [Smallanthus sonchifolius]|uniref:Uncharacterized protein n=1 Tax=Smallanthus sonchifolius TaxID=185202 RepID=A0ACB9HG04_9ASTR|nr:hypothetical protein L1987_37068 [Smallanthus sonchifolius]
MLTRGTARSKPTAVIRSVFRTGIRATTNKSKKAIDSTVMQIQPAVSVSKRYYKSSGMNSDYPVAGINLRKDILIIMIEDSSSSYSSAFNSKPSVAYGLCRSSTGSGANFVAGLHKDTPAESKNVSTYDHEIRKERIYWSTELHWQFFNALHQLGGSQAATPKQIRELMQVDGLTNDKVKNLDVESSKRFPSSNASSANQSGGALGGGLFFCHDICQDLDVESSKRCFSMESFDAAIALLHKTVDDLIIKSLSKNVQFWPENKDIVEDGGVGRQNA